MAPVPASAPAEPVESDETLAAASAPRPESDGSEPGAEPRRHGRSIPHTLLRAQAATYNASTNIYAFYEAPPGLEHFDIIGIPATNAASSLEGVNAAHRARFGILYRVSKGTTSS